MNGLPAATVVTRGGTVLTFDRKRRFTIAANDHVVPIHRLADQDGWLGEVLCRHIKHNEQLAIPAANLRLD